MTQQGAHASTPLAAVDSPFEDRTVEDRAGADGEVESTWNGYPEGEDIAVWNNRLAKLTAQERVVCAMGMLPGTHMLSSSFGAQAAVSLHMLTAVQPDIPVVLVDTGYLFPETYGFIESLQQRLQLNLHTYRAATTPAWQEARHGQRWLQGADALDAYNFENKVEPMQRALDELNVGTWFTGVRRSQAQSRRETPFMTFNGDYYKVAPLADWSDRDVFEYLKRHDLPYHPLWEEGYVSIGDVHTTRALHEVDSAEETRFFGLKRECGLHDQL